MQIHALRVWLAHAVLSLSLTAPSLLAQRPAAAEPPPVRREGKFFAVHCHGGDEALADRALAVVDRVWLLVAARLGRPGTALKSRPVVHLYRTDAGYRAAEQKLTGGKFARNLAMAHHDSHTAHVALQPPCRDEVLRAIGLPHQTEVLLAWEASHLARFAMCPAFRQHPDWYADGFAAAVAFAATGGSDAEWAQQPFWSGGTARVQRLQAAGKLPPVRSIVDDQIADLELHDRYALRREWLRFLDRPERQRELEKFSALLSGKGGSGFETRLQRAAQTAFGGLQADFAAHVAAQQPVWDEVIRSLAVSADGWQQIAFPDSNAVAWAVAPVAGGSLAVRGRLRILPGGRQQLNFLFGRTAAGFLSVAFVADQGFTVFAYDAAADRWDSLGSGAAPALRLGVATPFVLTATGRKLAIGIEDLSWEFELPQALPEAVVWGLGAQAGGDGASEGSAGIWQGVEVGPAK